MLVWHANPLFELPSFPPAAENQTAYWHLRFAYTTPVPIVRMLENLYDYYHLKTLHNLAVLEFEATPLEWQTGAYVSRNAWFGAQVRARIKRFVGPVGWLAQLLGLKMEWLTIMVAGWPTGHVVTTNSDGQERFMSLNSATPIAPGVSVQHNILAIKRTGQLWRDLFYYALFGLQTKAAAAQDLKIWQAMKADGGGVFVKFDRRVLEFRQFYLDWVQKVSTRPCPYTERVSE